jgi:hypothetical protein
MSYARRAVAVSAVLHTLWRGMTTSCLQDTRCVLLVQVNGQCMANRVGIPPNVTAGPAYGELPVNIFTSTFVINQATSSHQVVPVVGGFEDERIVSPLLRRPQFARQCARPRETGKQYRAD